MEVSALTRMWNLLMLLFACVQKSCLWTSGPRFRIVPSRLQLFEYESVSFNCKGFDVSDGWMVKNNEGSMSKCSERNTTDFVCTFKYSLEPDSGGYWCEGGGGERSNTVNITVTGGNVILESPVLPVMEGDDVTLRCRVKATSSNLKTFFYRDGFHVRTSSTGNITIYNVSKSDAGQYKCRTGADESPESSLIVRGSEVKIFLEIPAHPITEGESVTLRCWSEKTGLNSKAEFYKDGHLVSHNFAGEVMIQHISKSDEGIYMCSITGAGQSAERQLSVKVQIPEFEGSGATSKDLHAHEDTTESLNPISFSGSVFLMFWSSIVVVITLSLVVIGLLCWKKQLVLKEVSMMSPVKGFHENQDSANEFDDFSMCLETSNGKKPHEGETLAISSFYCSAYDSNAGYQKEKTTMNSEENIYETTL